MNLRYLLEALYRPYHVLYYHNVTAMVMTIVEINVRLTFTTTVVTTVTRFYCHYIFENVCSRPYSTVGVDAGDVPIPLWVLVRDVPRLAFGLITADEPTNLLPYFKIAPT